MERENILLKIEQDSLVEAEFMCSNFIDTEIKNRAFLNTLGAEAGASYLTANDISIAPARHIHSIKRVLGKTNIADIILPTIHIDVRVIFDEDVIFVPKSHFDYEIVPDVYMVLKYKDNAKYLEFAGYFQPEIIDFSQEHDGYYFIDKTKLYPAESFINFILDYDGNTEKVLSAKEIERGQELSARVSDDDITDDEYKEYLKLLVSSPVLRDSVLEYDNFETLAVKVAHYMSTTPAYAKYINDDSIKNNSDIDNANNISEDNYNYESQDLYDSDTITDEVEDFDTNVTDDIMSDIPETSGFSSGAASDSVMELAALAGELEESLTNNEETDNSDNAEESTVDTQILDTDASDVTQTESTDNENSVIDFDTIKLDDIQNDNESMLEFSENSASNLINQDDLLNLQFNTDELLNFEGYEEQNENNSNFTPLDYLQDLNGLEYKNDENDNSNSDDNDVENSDARDNLTDYTGHIESNALIEEFITDSNETVLPNIEKNYTESEGVEFGDIIPNESDTNDMTYKEEPDEDSLFDFGTDIENQTNQQIDSTNTSETIEEADNTVDMFDGISLDDSVNESDDISFDDLADDSDNRFDDISSDDLADDSDNGFDDISADDFMDDSDNVYNEISVDNITDNEDTSYLSEDFIDNHTTSAVDEQNDENNEEFEDFGNFAEFEENKDNSEENENIVEGTENSDIAADIDENYFESDEEITDSNDETEVYIDDEVINHSEVIENSVIISDQDFEPGEILLDINKAYLPEFEDNELNSLYDNNNPESELQNDVRISSKKNFNISPKYGILGLFLIIITAGVILFSVSKITNSTKDTPKPLTDNLNPDNSPEQIPTDIVNPDNVVMNSEEDAVVPTAPTPSVKPVKQAENSPEVSPQKKAEPPARTVTPNASSSQQNVNMAQNTPTRHIPPTEFMTIKKLSWEVPDYISYNEEYKQFFQSSGKALKTALSSDILLATNYTYSNTVKLSITFMKDGKFKEAKIISSSGSSEVDKIILQSVNQTLTILKAPPSVAKDESTTVILKIIL